MKTSSFQVLLCEKSALSGIEVITRLIHYCNDHRPYYATQYQDIFIQYIEFYNFATGKPLSEFKV